ncbi:MAG: MlaD family protein [Phycisphaerae bacterium]|nr:MlaD family protein [Phycisphaerae bacterium]
MSDYEAAQRRRDVAVGIFVILGLGALGWMILKFGDLPTTITRMKSFQVYVQFPTAPGVMKDTPVRFCGYQVGRVTTVMAPQVRMDLNTGQKYHQTLCVLSINRKYTDIPCNIEVKLMTRGLGSSYLELKVDPRKLPAPPRDPNDLSTCFLKEGMAVQGSTGITSEFFPEESQQKLDQLVEGIGTFISNANHIIGDPNNQRNFKVTLANLSKTSDAFPAAVDQAIALMKDAQKTLEEFRQLATTGNETLKNADGKMEQLVASMVATSDEIGKSVAQLRLTVEKINSGQGSAGRLINDGRLYEGLLEDTTQLNLVLKDLKELLNKVNEKGLRSIY